MQVAVAGLAIFSMPLWIIGLDEVYQSNVTVDPLHLVIGVGFGCAGIMTLTLLALDLGHSLGGPAAATRTLLASVSAGRNPGLALLVAVFNGAAPGVIATILAYLFVSALTAIPYLIWRRWVAEKSGVAVS